MNLVKGVRMMAAGLLVLVAAAQPTGAVDSPAPVVVTIDADQHFQTVTGLGVNANVHSWKNGELKPAIDQIAALGEVTWRVIIDREDWEAADRRTDPFSYDWDYYERIYERGKMADLWATIAYINSKPGQQVVLSAMGGVPEWMGGTHIDTSREDNWVQMMSSMVYYGRTKKQLNFTLFSPLNEPDWNGVEGPKVEPDQYVRLLHKLAERLDQLGVPDMKFVGPDTADAGQTTKRYYPALAADPVVMDHMALLGIHSYTGDAAGLATRLGRTATLWQDFWVTEFSGPCPGCDMGAPNPANWDSASVTAHQAISLLQQGASGLQLYDGWDGFYEHHGSMGYWGALAYDANSGIYTPRKTFFVLQQLISFVSRSAVRIKVTVSDGSIDLVGFLDQTTGRLTLFGQNTGPAATVILATGGLKANDTLRYYRTSADVNLQRENDVVVANSAFSLTIPAASVFTLTGGATAPVTSPESGPAAANLITPGASDTEQGLFSASASQPGTSILVDALVISGLLAIIAVLLAVGLKARRRASSSAASEEHESGWTDSAGRN